MKRLLYWSALLASAPCFAVAPKAHVVAKASSVETSRSALPAFTFKSVTAGEIMDPASVGTCSPTDDGIPGKLDCRGKDSAVAGVDLLLAPDYMFYNGRLTMMMFLFDTKGTNFLTFASAFRDKYGPPCHESSEKWQSRGGSTFDNNTLTWCFKSGKLKLDQLGPSLEYGAVTYTDDYSAPSKPTPKDF